MATRCRRQVRWALRPIPLPLPPRPAASAEQHRLLRVQTKGLGLYLRQQRLLRVQTKGLGLTLRLAGMMPPGKDSLPLATL